MSNGESPYTPIMSTAAAVTGILSLLRARRECPTGELVIPDELLEAIAAIAATSDAILNALLQFLSDPHITVKAWPSNVDSIKSRTVTCVQADVAYPAPPIAVPDGMHLLIKAHPLNAVGSTVRVATNKVEVLDPDESYEMLPNEAVAWPLTNADKCFVSSAVAGSRVIFSAGQAKDIMLEV